MTDPTSAPAADTTPGNTVATDSTMSAIRTLLGVLAGWLVGKGYLSQDQAGPVVSAVLVIAPVLWGVVEKFKSEKVTQARIVAAVATAAAQPQKP